MGITLGELAKRLDLSVFGSDWVEITHVAPLDKAGNGALAFLTHRRYRRYLATTSASAVILTADDLPFCRTSALISPNPALTYRRAVRFLVQEETLVPGIHASAVVSPQARIDRSCRIGAQAVIDEDVVVEAGCDVGPGSYLARGAHLGAGTRLLARVFIGHEVVVGRECMIQAGAAIGCDGFGFARDQEVWERIPQLGTVRIGDRVEIGANTCIDRGALEDTVIEDGVKLDNLIQIGHNVRIGAHTIVAGSVGIAGSTKIGKCCQIGGMVGIIGHLEIADHVIITARSMITQSIHAPGVYSGGIPSDNAARWRRNTARFRQLDEMANRLHILEKKLDKDP
ncbi:UDP-3-O-(3-hydroxymyristoyl) glucosamine N-acyltransferase [mine drainage metagenome]|uniref:UDP-3-O-(3-hydroxymyristoyl) glucosamine N-acyltransferase n=1 Tax=mine drainage metagenome TaxID=410659 RepID=T0ZZM4_9ZZZZ